jgi:hypothetical protein
MSYVFDKSTTQRIDFIEKNYNQYVEYHLNKPEKIKLGSESDIVCRFCNKTSPEVSFNSVAHAIPEFTNNKYLIANYECDQCNNKFSRLLESHMANYMNLYHTLSQVIGKKGVPSFKTIHQKKSRIDIGKEFLEIENHEEDCITTINEEEKTITFESTRASYIPIALYKCLVKMALTIMPDDEIHKFSHALKWINEENHNESSYNINPLPIFFSFAPGIKPLKFTSCLLFKRKKNPENLVPYMLFVLAYGNFVFQVHVPMSNEDKELIGKESKIVHVPSPIDMEKGANYVDRQVLEMSSKDLRKGEKAKVVMKYENAISLPLKKSGRK